MSRTLRSLHRWVSMLFTMAVVANIVAMSLSRGQMPPPWITYAPLLPLFVLMLTGIYLFVLPYVSKRSPPPPHA